MKDFTVSVKKLTDEDLLREACESTFLGKSHASLLSLYKAEHSPVRTQMFWIKFKTIPLFISTHLLRHHVGSVPFQLTCRDDRKGGNPGVKGKCGNIVQNLRTAFESVDDSPATVQEKIATTIEEVEWLAENSDRYTSVNLSLLVNAQSLIDMSKLRICWQAHPETRIVFNKLKEAMKEVDPDLAKMMVRKCVYRASLCGEQRCCGFNSTKAFLDEWEEYASNFTQKQKGLINFTEERQ